MPQDLLNLQVQQFQVMSNIGQNVARLNRNNKE